ncbi:sodium:proton antiporter [Methylobacterium sp. Leaf87]|uniref:Na+/H+ antiporter NhaA n=1 Tax=Methylobacterium sp. Leaf87 TaxID=1736243 RepID=UPI0006FEB015|nr:Na+/H+ antiporter NhaA [Methylobacterium sp. Leaf87]KQO65783.1 sodium:proton antiporter [Methylobacterium sp. Leaf87]
MSDVAVTRARVRKPSLFRSFLDHSASGGLVLMLASALALLVANSGLAGGYHAALQAHVGPLSLLHWINDALMALFFLMVGLEIKREMLDGQLATWRRRVLPGIAALGGMAVPALVYVAFNLGDADALRGWAVPAATDIAFALGVLSLLGSRVPASLKVFLAALAILDDLCAVLIIAVFYTAELSLPMLGASAIVVALLVGLNRAGVTRLWPYLALGAVLWVLVLKSGVHATLAGVVLALAIPLRNRAGMADDMAISPLHRLEHALHIPVAFVVLPIFGFANAGVSFGGVAPEVAMGSVSVGVAAGLFLGKQLGVFGGTWLALRTGLAVPPVGATTLQLYGTALLCGIGFTMSLFIGLLAFPTHPEMQDAVKIGVMVGSVLSGVLGAGVLAWAGRGRRVAIA